MCSSLRLNEERTCLLHAGSDVSRNRYRHALALESILKDISPEEMPLATGIMTVWTAVLIRSSLH